MTNEQLSVWVDGEAGPQEAARVLEAVTQNAAQREICEVYWLIGDALRGQLAGGRDLSERVMAELSNEPTVLAPRQRLVGKGDERSSGWLRLAAAVAGVAVAAWMGLSMTVPVQQSASQALAEAPKAVDSSPDALEDEQAYYMAHQGSAMGAPMGGVAQYIRTVSDERAGMR